MNSAPQLLVEDRPEFERVLDEALRTTQRGPGRVAAGQRLNVEQLRTMALAAAVPIAACAAVEYEQFVALREELRRSANAPSADSASAAGTEARAGAASADGGGAGGSSASGGSADESRETGAAGLGLAGAMTAGLTDTAGAGLVAIVSVLAPLLAGAAAVIFLLVGYALHMLSPEPSVAGAMRNTGWAFAVLAAATALAGMAGLLLTALRNGASSVGVADAAGVAGAAYGGDPHGALAAEVGAAREAWRGALLERGMLPFLREALTDPKVAPAQPPEPYLPDGRSKPDGRHGADEHRTPRLGYSHPRYSSPSSSGGSGASGGSGTTGPGETDTTTRPRFSSPDYSSPDYGGPEHQPE